ncbi:indole-3-glycerol phosphate synthase TrpC [Hyphomonas sp.]|uniref:indole-3-glycerol phosphate synthase TrpC n=1 Tax=Hyphomonas sp. TaxID=87 RepID=UPI0025BB1756|nr:indole-3-glycerol phosphate synthase TrpC [Hyphomonas sp.]MBI1400674.1 indole-3-glycerol phosphate synthase TrpC [Hyphomonas sp.]
MTTALDRILAYKSDEVRALKAQRSVSDLLADAKAQASTRGFCAGLDAVAASGENALICEIKRKSPSAGDILPGAVASEIARDYEKGGAACLSVLTDGPSFGGSLSDFEDIRNSVQLPMLRKDFMIDPYQIIESRAHGADCILIILSAVDDACARDLGQTATDLGMDVLVETHDEPEIERALRLSFPLIGVNNRDLKRMVTDLGTSERLSPLVPGDRQIVSESGISDPEHIIRLRSFGLRRFLIGESLMKRPDRTAFTEALRTAN